MAASHLCPERGIIGSTIASASIIENKDSRSAQRAESRRSQRMLNVFQPGTTVVVHRHLKTSETAICMNMVELLRNLMKKIGCPI